MTKQWTDEELKLARQMRADDLSFAMIAYFLGRTRGAVASKLDRSSGRRRERKVETAMAEAYQPWHPARDPIPARYDWFHGARQEQTAV